MVVLSADQILRAKNDWEKLGLSDGASAQDIRKAYLQLSKVWHPSKFARLSDAKRTQAGEVFIAVKKAYEALRVVSTARPQPVVPDPQHRNGQQQTSAFAQHVAQAKDYLRKQDWSRARRTLQAVLQKRSGDTTLTALMHAAWGFEHLTRGDYSGAQDSFAEALALNPKLRLAQTGAALVKKRKAQ